MLDASVIVTDNKTDFYIELNTLLTGLISDELDWLANASNASALLFQMLPNINWAGLYLLKEGELVLGPFQGKPACVRIQMGKGVCGTAALTRETQVVEDVEKFPGHIACDAASQSSMLSGADGQLRLLSTVKSSILFSFLSFSVSFIGTQAVENKSINRKIDITIILFFFMVITPLRYI